MKRPLKNANGKRFVAALIHAAWAACALFVVDESALAQLPHKVRFNEQIRPILSDRCFACHGPDEKKREAELRLDLSAGATRDLGGRAAIVPGKPNASELLARVTSDDAETIMPPPKSKKPRLTVGEVALLRKWIELGAEYEGHWAFLPLRNEPLPDVKDKSWPRNAIDQFVLALLERDGIRPSPEADKATLFRRVSLDLLGLLPSPEEVERFVGDTDPRAYEMLVERLLSSPHYGERWGRHWLDQARYADSSGYAIDAEREMWPYRDWVIAALNDDLPFDRFTIEQLAGDLLPSPSKQQLVATAYHRNTLINQEGGTDREQFRVESVLDRANTTGAVWLGLTVGCAQCHAHKFDPISQREYYELTAFFNSAADANDAGPTLQVVRGEVFGNPMTLPPPETPALSGAELTKRRMEWEAEMRGKLEKLAAASATTPVKWLPAKYLEYGAASKAEFTLLEDNSLLTGKGLAPNDTYRVLATTPLKKVAAVRLRTLIHDSLPTKGPGTAGHGNFVMTKFELAAKDEKVHFAAAWADHEQSGYPVVGAIDNDPKTGWAINAGANPKAKMNADHEAVFVLDKTLDVADRPLQIHLFHEANPGYLIGRFAIEFSETAPPPPKDGGDALLLAALQTPAEQLTAAQKTLLQEAFERAEPRAKPPVKKVNRNVAQLMIMRDLPQPRETFLLTRGDFTRPDKALGPLAAGALKAVPPFAFPTDQPAGRITRLDLAKWLVHPDNPLTPRVTVNRLWMRYFGRGLVETDEDFGAQGTAPTHSALLDWLAAELNGSNFKSQISDLKSQSREYKSQSREFKSEIADLKSEILNLKSEIPDAWSLKRLHRLIVTSATYRQSSKPRADLLEKDPRNLLLARQERIRFEAEITRDAALCASGLLDQTIGGPSVRPPQPDGVYAFTQVNKQWATESGANRYRRAMYTFFYRSAPYPLFTTFDAPDFQAVCTRRLRSNTPLQSLTLANDAAFVEMARGLAARLAAEIPGDTREQLDARIRRACLLCLSRPPSPREQTLLRDYFLRELEHFSKNVAEAQKLAPAELVNGAPPNSVGNALRGIPEFAALICLARAVLNTDNFIMRE